MTHPSRSSRNIFRSAWQKSLFLCFLLSFSAFAGAAGWVSILKGTPAETFQDQDLRLFLDAAKQALGADELAQTVNWRNADTGAGGDFLVLKQSVAADGSLCKRVLFTVFSSKQPAKKATWTACKAGDGPWKLVAPD